MDGCLVLETLRSEGFSGDSCAMNRRHAKGYWLTRKYESGCDCAFGSTEPIANGSRVVYRHDSVLKDAMPDPEPVSTAAADGTGTGDERINHGGEYSGSRRKDSEAKGQRRPRRAVLTDVSCGSHHPKSRGSHSLGIGLGCRSVTGLGDESIVKIHARRSVHTKESAEALVNQKFIDGEKSKQFMEALYVLNSNKALFVKLLEDPNSFLAKHIRELRESGENGRRSETASEAETARKGGRDEAAGTLSPRKLKIWEKLLPRRSAKKDKSCEIVILKPGSENEHGGGNRGSYFGSDGTAGNGIRAIGQSRLPLGSLRKKSKHRMGGNDVAGFEATRIGENACEGAELAAAPSYECKELNRESFVQRLSRDDQVKVLLNIGLADAVKRDLGECEERSRTPRDYQMSDQCKSIPNEERDGNFAAIHDTGTMEPGDRPPLTRTSRSPDHVASKLDLVEIAEPFLQAVRRDQTASSSSSSDDSFSNSTEESETTSAEEEHESPVFILEIPVTSPTHTPAKPDRATSDTPLNKFGQATEFVRSILISSNLSWDTILLTYDSPNQFLRGTGSGPHQSGFDARLLCDYASEVLGEVIGHRWHSYQRGLVVDGDVASEVMKWVDWDLVLPQDEQSSTMECIITRDVTKNAPTSWIQLGKETDEIVVELMGKIIEDAVDDILLCSGSWFDSSGRPYHEFI